MVERTAVNRLVVGSNPTSGARFQFTDSGGYWLPRGPAYIPLDSPVRDEARVVKAQPSRLQAQSTHILFELSDSPFHSPSCLTVRLQAGYPPDVSNSSPEDNPAKAGAATGRPA